MSGSGGCYRAAPLDPASPFPQTLRHPQILPPKEPNMRVVVPREIKPDEYRVGLTPTAVREYVTHGHEVFVEAGAGAGAGYPDEAYIRAGAKMLPTADEVFKTATLIVKVKEPQAVEW